MEDIYLNPKTSIHTRIHNNILCSPVVWVLKMFWFLLWHYPKSTLSLFSLALMVLAFIVLAISGSTEGFSVI